jgi:hypothetical protein
MNNDTRPAPAPLLEALHVIPAMAQGRRLVVVWGQLGDFDSFEYAQALVPVLPQLERAGVNLHAFAIGNAAGKERFCSFTGFPGAQLTVLPDATLHRALELYRGVATPAGPWPNLLLMCAGIGSPGTLAEVLRGYTGDRRAPQRLDWPLFKLAGGDGCLRPFELATVRLQNMVEVLGNWRTYVPTDAFLTQRGATFLLDPDDSLLYAFRDRGILGFSSTMARPLQFLDGVLNTPAAP